MDSKSYTIGLDIGTNSVGWAVLTADNNLIRRRMKVKGDTGKNSIKKNFWGVRLFDEGLVAADRRLNRTTKRRLDRRRNRIKYLQEIFAPEMLLMDKEFFTRLDETFLTRVDKQESKHPIFGTLTEELDYHENYPTIYHLRKKLADSEEKADLRLIYLALAHIIKYRGHFLIEGELNTQNTSIEATFGTFISTYNEIISNSTHDNLQTVLEDVNATETFEAKLSPSKKADEVLALFNTEKKNGAFHQFIKMMVGLQGNFKKMFDLEEDAKLQFSKETYEDDLESLLGIIGDDYADLFNSAKNVYDAIELFGIITASEINTKAKLSASMIQRYDEHREDLKKLKSFVGKNLSDDYEAIFLDNTVNGYAGYIEKGVKQEDFYTFIKKKLDGIQGANYFIEKIEQKNFLRKQRTFDNGVIPHQIHLQELQAIIDNQQSYYPFLNNEKKKIESLVTFRIPYYVGPLANGHSDFSWLKRLSDEPIRPWNLSETVDLSHSAINFIERMTNNDTYLPKEKVLPKHSMLYEKFAIYNELTKVKYIDDRGLEQNFSGIEKKQIFEELFKNNRKVSKKLLEKYIKDEFNIETPQVIGIESSFNASFGTYQDFVKMGVSKELLDDSANQAMFEEIVKIMTIFEDRKMIGEQLSKFSSYYSGAVMKKIERRHYTGWGRFSAELIDGIRDDSSGKTILDYLIEDDGPNKNINRNFMQLINDTNLSFKNKIEDAQEISSSLTLEDTVSGLAGSPAIKKGILQSLKIVDELVDIMGYLPSNIVIEMARENQTTSKGRKNSLPRLKNLETALADIKSDLLKIHPVDNKALQNDRLYLYYLQNGRDMYTGDHLDINKLSNYDIDHIIPQSFTTDNSLDNKVLVSSSENRGKSDDVPSLEVIKRMELFWESLKKSNLISERKLKNLMKGRNGGLTEDDRAGFIQRQLVETRQITKNVAEILHHRFNVVSEDDTSKVKIVTLKSALTSQFRQNFGLHKVREINDYHHAHDAYLNGVVANALLKVYPNLEPEFVYGQYSKYNSFSANKATAKKQFQTNLMKFFARDEAIVDENGEILWNKKTDIPTVKKVLSYRQINIVKKPEIQKGIFSKANSLAKGSSNKLIPVKNGLDPNDYGGFTSPNTAYSVVFTHLKGKKAKLTTAIIGITIMERLQFEQNECLFLEEKGFINPVVKRKLPKYALIELENGRRRMIASYQELQKRKSNGIT